MSYILKNTSGLVSTRITDTGRLKLSQGNFNISYFQIGDSEVSYNELPNTYNQSNSVVLEPSFNSQNNAGSPESNKQNIKYPYYVDDNNINTYGIPFMDSVIEPVYNRAPLRGFFTGNTTASTINYSAFTGSKYVVTSNYIVDMSTLDGSNQIKIIQDICDPTNTNKPGIGDFITIYYDGLAKYDCSCVNLPTPTPTPSVSSVPEITCSILMINYDDWNNVKIMSYDPNTNTSVNLNGLFSGFINPYSGGTDIAHTQNKIFYSISDNQVVEYNYTNSPFSATFSRIIYIDNYFTLSTSLGVKDNNTLLFWNQTQAPPPYTNSYAEVDITTNTGVTTNIFSLPTNRIVWGDVEYVPGNQPKLISINGLCVSGCQIFFSQYDYNTGLLDYEVDITSTGAPFGVFSYLGENYVCCGSGDIYKVDSLPPYSLTLFDNTGFPIGGSSSIPGCSGTTPTLTNTPTVSNTNLDPCASPTPTPTPSATPCLTPSNKPVCPIPPDPSCVKPVHSCFPILTYRIIDICENNVTLDRPTPNYIGLSTYCFGRVLVYPPNMTTIYDSITPRPHWSDDVINFESICDIDQFDVKVWNMNIPWTESPAGLRSTEYEDYTYFGSIDYIGSKEYFGYNSTSGQTDTSYVYYYNSFDEIVQVKPEEQKAIAIIHYTNQTIDFFYGEKFALEPYNNSNPDDTTGQARNFKLHMPTLMWHKNPECCYGQTFWVDPPGFDGKDLFQVQYIKSTKNPDMNQPGIRYYHLWDTNANADGLPSRVGKVFPDSKLIIIDDEEIIAALSYKSNRNWTLTAPQVSLITPNTCGLTTTTTEGILTGSSETMFVTYRLSNPYNFTNSLHSNYYSKITGNNNDCNPDTSKNVGVRFGAEFKCLTQPGYNPVTTTTTYSPLTTTTTYPLLTTTTTYLPLTTTTTTHCPTTCDTPNGFFATNFQVIAQKVVTGQRPDPSKWKVIDYTSSLSATTINGYITEDGLTGTTFVITPDLYNNAPYYNLNNFIPLTPLGTTTPNLNFGDEYFFYGSFESDIQATIYEMRYKVNLSFAEFQTTTNPTWKKGSNSYITEITLLDSNKDVMVVSKMQSPVLRQGIQQFVVKLDL